MSSAHRAPRQPGTGPWFVAVPSKPPMNLLVISQHAMLLERLRTAFAGAGHSVEAVPDHLHALASEAWTGAQLMLVDAAGTPMDGFRLCHLLRAESRSLFRSLPIFLILDHPPTPADQARLAEVDGDGLLEADASLQTLLAVLGPLVAGANPRGRAERTRLLALGLAAAQMRQIAAVTDTLGFELTAGTLKLARQLNPPIVFVGLGPSPQAVQTVPAPGPPGAVQTAQNALHTLAGLPRPCYPILVGPMLEAEGQGRLLAQGAMDWLVPPLSMPILHLVCRRAQAWIHAMRIQRECQHQIQDLVAQRRVLEQEASALRSEVVTDSLTELLNRKAFNQHLEHASNQWDRHKRAFVLILGDLDYFKLINDRFGHMVGDKVLKAVAQRITASLRRSDLAFRIGGEEFAILLTESSLRAGAEVAEKIRRTIDQQPVTLESGQNVFPTMSFGVGAADSDDSAALFARVDQALYVAKRKGRNRVEVLTGDD